MRRRRRWSFFRKMPRSGRVAIGAHKYNKNNDGIVLRHITNNRIDTIRFFAMNVLRINCMPHRTLSNKWLKPDSEYLHLVTSENLFSSFHLHEFAFINRNFMLAIYPNIPLKTHPKTHNKILLGSEIIHRVRSICTLASGWRLFIFVRTMSHFGQIKCDEQYEWKSPPECKAKRSIVLAIAAAA